MMEEAAIVIAAFCRTSQWIGLEAALEVFGWMSPIG